MLEELDANHAVVLGRWKVVGDDITSNDLEIGKIAFVGLFAYVCSLSGAVGKGGYVRRWE